MNLSLKLALLISLLAALASIFVSLMSYRGIEQRVSDSAQRSVGAHIRTVYSMASTAAYVSDQELANEVIRGLINNIEITCAMIISPKLRVQSSESCAGEPFPASTLLSPWDDSEKVGELIVFLNTRYVREESKAQLWREVVAIIRIIVFISAAIAVLTWLLITRPIGRLSQRLKKINFEDSLPLLHEGARKDELGAISRVINLLMITAKKQIMVEQQLANKTQLLTHNFKMIFQLSRNAMAITDGQLQLQSFNPSFDELVRPRAQGKDLLGSSDWLACICDNAEELAVKMRFANNLEEPIKYQIERTLDTGNCEQQYFTLTFTKTAAKNGDTTVLIFIHDVTESKIKFLQTEHEANHDSLTQLLNRTAATRKIRHLLSALVPADEGIALLVMDLDGFKAVNDSLGHEAGDTVLKEVAQRIKKTIRKSDIACRWGGDEFVIALVDILPEQAEVLAEKIRQAILEPIELNSGELRRVGASIGVSNSNSFSADFATLFDQADKAMFQIKRSGKQAIKVFSENES